MLREAKTSFASQSLHIEIELLVAVGPKSGTPGEGDSGAVGRESRGGCPAWQSRKRNDSQGRLLLRSLMPAPSIDNEGCKRKDRDGDNACANLHPQLTTVRT